MLNKLLITFLFSFALTSICMALDENHYDEQYKLNIVPLIHNMQDGFFTGEKNLKIHYKTFLQSGAKNCLVILPGRTEPVEKYAEVVYDLSQTAAGKNLNFYLLDHRGQGSSERMKKPSHMGYVDHFHNFVLDIETFLTNQKLDSKCEKKFLLAHSMGAGISTAFILEHPAYFNKVSFISPMLKIMTKPYSYGVARAIVETSTLVGRGAKFAIGQKGFDPLAKFEDNEVTTSPARFKMTMSVYETFPMTKVGGVSNKFVLEVMRGTNRLRSRYHEISTPMKVFYAGLESLSEPSEMVKLCDEAINCQPTFFATSKHEVLMERDEIRSKVINSLSEFFN